MFSFSFYLEIFTIFATFKRIRFINFLWAIPVGSSAQVSQLGKAFELEQDLNPILPKEKIKF